MIVISDSDSFFIEMEATTAVVVRMFRDEDAAKQLADMGVDRTEISTCDSRLKGHFSRHNHFNRHRETQ